MNHLKFLFILFLVLSLPVSNLHATTLERGVSEQISQENEPVLVEMYQIRFQNDLNGTIEVSSDRGKSWEQAGKVLRPTNKVSRQGYTASKWVDFPSVAATAVNAIHIAVDYNQPDDKGVVFSLLPKEFYVPPKNYNSFYSPDSSIMTDITAGTSIFGGGYAPFVGNKLFILKEGGPLDLERGYVPEVGDRLLIKVGRPIVYPLWIEFENRFGGLISIKYRRQAKKYIGQVLRPVMGVGRFSGSQFTDIGRIRANHAGVICVSTSVLGDIGGFQIVPANHGMSPEMQNARLLTQWMVISPISALDPSLEGIAPFFRYYIQPQYSSDDLDKEDWYKRMVERFLVQCRVNYGDWQSLPNFTLYLDRSLPDWAGSAIKDITHFRILFPIYTESTDRYGQDTDR